METTACCPECESADIRTQSSQPTKERTSDHAHQCRDCRYEFDEPAEREANASTAPPVGSLARKLWDMDRDTEEPHV